MSVISSIRICIEDIGFEYINNPYIKFDYKQPYWIKDIDGYFVLVILNDIKNDVFTRNSLIWFTNCFDMNDNVMDFINEYEQQVYKNINTWIYIQKKQGLSGGGELEVYNWDRIIDGCCLYCDHGYDGCWCDECKCKECDAYLKCDCGSGKGYCDLINYVCADCRKVKSNDA